MPRLNASTVCLHKGGIVKQNTDITGFVVKKIPTVNKNHSLSFMPTAYAARVDRFKKLKEKRFSRSKLRVKKALSSLEATDEKQDAI